MWCCHLVGGATGETGLADFTQVFFIIKAHIGMYSEHIIL